MQHETSSSSTEEVGSRSTPNQHIIIIGGGLGGLCLAQGLKKAGISFCVYERDPTSDFRPQGYRIRLNHFGALGLKACLSEELWKIFEETCAKTVVGMTRIDAVECKVTSEVSGPEVLRTYMTKDVDPSTLLGPYTVDRRIIRTLLLNGLKGSVQFGKTFTHYSIEQNDDQKKVVVAHFDDGTVARGDLIVGADGLKSRVRRQFLPDHVPVDLDMRGIYGKTVITPELLDRFPSSAMKWITFIQDSRPLTLFVEPVRFNADPAQVSPEFKVPSTPDYVYWALGSRSSIYGLDDSELLGLTGENAAQLTLKLTEGWSPDVRSLLQLQTVDECAVVRISSVLPIIPAWEPSRNVTLLGDAVHVMSPTGGAGANTALFDAAKLCAVLKEGDITEAAIGEYENAMRGFARKAIEYSWEGGKRICPQLPFEEGKPLELN